MSNLDRGRPIWFGGEDRSEASMSQFYAWLGERKSSRLRLAVMDMWKPFRQAAAAHVSVISLFDVLCFPLFDGPIGEFGKSAPDATQHAAVLAAVKDAARR